MMVMTAAPCAIRQCCPLVLFIHCFKLLHLRCIITYSVGLYVVSVIVIHIWFGALLQQYKEYQTHRTSSNAVIPPISDQKSFTLLKCNVNSDGNISVKD